MERVKAVYAEAWEQFEADDERISLPESTAASGGDGDGAEGDSAGASALIKVNAERQMTVFDSAAAAYFRSREYQGLERHVPVGHSTDILQGQFGIAAEYAPMVVTGSETPAAAAAEVTAAITAAATPEATEVTATTATTAELDAAVVSADVGAHPAPGSS